MPCRVRNIVQKLIAYGVLETRPNGYFAERKYQKVSYNLKGQFERTIKAAGLKDATFHTLRHTAASHMVMAGVDISTVQVILRHKSIAMTQRYAHLSPEHKKGAVDALQKALAGKTKAGIKTA